MGNQEIQVGDVVKLRSGGPKMTVDEISGDQAGCTYFDEKQQIVTSTFVRLVALVKLERRQNGGSFQLRR